MSHDIRDGQFRSLIDKWEMVDCLMGGTDAMRDAGELYLPKYSLESDELYNMRLRTSTLYNAYRRAIEVNTSKITSRNIQIDGGSTQLQNFLNNVDSCNTNINEFGKNLIRNAMNHGITYILVDYPRLATYRINDISTLKPYFVNILATQVLSIRSRKVKGSHELVYFKYKVETVPEYTSWDESNEEKITEVREYQKNENDEIWFRVKQLIDRDWVTVDEGVMDGLEFIPIVPVYGKRTGFMLGEPLLQDLAELNVRHWQSSSDQQWVLHFARSPILFLKGVESRDENGLPKQINVGPNSVIATDRTDADAKYVEHTGSAIEAGRKDLEELENQMNVMGLDIAVDKSGTMTATGRAINAAGADSILKSLAVQLETALTSALILVEMYYGNVTPFTVNVNKEYIPVFDSKEMTDIWEMYREGLVSAGEVLKEAKRRNLLSAHFTIPTEMKTKMYSQQSE